MQSADHTNTVIIEVKDACLSVHQLTAPYVSTETHLGDEDVSSTKLSPMSINMSKPDEFKNDKNSEPDWGFIRLSLRSYMTLLLI